MTTATMIAIIAAIVVAAVLVWFVLQRERSRKLRGRFGPEYDRLVQERGDRRHAETELERRAKRVDKLNIRPLSRQDKDNFAEAWREQQARFVADPRSAVEHADALVSN